MAQLTITYDTFMQAMTQCTRMGYMQAVKAYEPDADFIRETEVKKWLRLLGLEFRTFSWLVENGDIKKRRKGNAANSPWLYSKADIVEKLCIANIHQSIIK